MKNIALLSISLALMLPLVGCQTATKESSSPQDFLTMLPGTYKGIIASGGVEFPGVTELSEENGVISGAYEFTENNAVVTGTLDNCKVISPLTLKCKWHDQYGTGNLSMNFNSSVRQFNGNWDMEGANATDIWIGSKQ
jgi:hypothetical protein